jgi:phosphoglycolate phosphatase-like HAD superfamily hydrolase
MPDQRILVFDLDGTLIDTMGPLLQIACDVLAEQRGINPDLTREVCLSFMGVSIGRQFREVLSQAGRLDDGVEDLTDIYYQRSEAVVPKAFPEVAEVLTELQSAGHLMAVSSGGKPALVSRRTAEAGIDGFFRLILGSEDGNPDKAKGPGHFRLISETLGLTAAQLRSEGVFIGDGVYDMQVAREAGMVAVGRVTDGNGETLRLAGAHYLVHDLREMHALLAAL